uniref:Uncharacterized protein n=1 Tax=Avena sativa TaxID=4498 RepID=A0ACD5TFX5_AVESA
MATLQMEPPAPPPRRPVSTSCDLHPDEAFTGFCAACLRERLAGLEASDVAPAAPGRRSTSAIRSLFSRPFGGGGGGAAPSGSGAAATSLPDLRRCKSFSCGRGGDALAADEPQRWSCDVRGRSTLWALFHQDDRERVRDGTAFAAFPASSSAAAAALPFEVQQHPHPPPCVPEVFLEEEIVMAESSDEITPVVEPISVAETSGEMATQEGFAAGEVKAMKDHIDLETAQPKKPPPVDLKEIAGSFWVAASVFSKKWQKWRRKQKLKKEAAGSKAAAAAMPPSGKPSKQSFLWRSRSRPRGEACSEFGGGRRSCDTDPRFSLDAARMSVDDAGLSWDGPRASWDGYLFGAGPGIGIGRAPPSISRLPPILSALEDSPAGIVGRSDGQIPVEDDSQPEPDGDVNTPGGSAQTRDYYMDTSSRRRRSLDRSSSSRRRSFEVPEPKPVLPVAAAIANARDRESPLIGSSEFYHFQHAEDLLDHRFSCSSLVDDFPTSLDAAFQTPAKKPRRKAWSLWDFIHRRATGRRNGSSDVADRAFSEPWPELRARGYNARTMTMQRCSSNASARSSFSSNSGGGTGMGSSRRCFVDGNGNGSGRRATGQLTEQCVLERNRSARYSPVQPADNGMLRLYLTPLRSASGRRASGLPANGGRHLRSQSFARTMLRLY